MSEVPLLVLHAAGLDFRLAEFLDLPGVVSVTLPAHGDRYRPYELTLSGMADEVAGWVHGPVDVVGLSMGGMVAQHLVLQHPDRVRSLVLACTTDRTPTQVLLGRAEETASAPQEETVAVTLERWFTADYLAQVPEPAGLAYARRCLGEIDPHAFADVWRALAAHDVADRIGKVEVPTTCLAGSHDVSTPPAVVCEMADRMPRSRLVEIDAPHMAPLERPAEFRRAVQEHLAWVEQQETG